MSDAPNELTAAEAGRRIARGQLTSEALVASCLERIAARERDVRAWAFLDPDLALRQARRLDREAPRSPLHGVPFGIKDVIDTADMPTEYNSPIYRGYQPKWDAACVALLRHAGCVILGKTVTTEFANNHPSHTRNPHNLAHTPGGSSSGSAAAVAAALVDFALGSDTGGSVRAPASFCGIYGMRPTHGRIPLDGVCPLAASFDTAGWFARDAALLERVGRVLLADEVAAPQPARWLLAQDAFALAGGAVTNALEPALAGLAVLLGKPRPVTVANEGLPQWFEVFRVLQGAEVWAQHGAWVTRENPALGPGVRQRMQWAATVTASDAAPARQQREEIARRMHVLLDNNAVLVLPTLPGIAPLRNTPPAESDEFRARALAEWRADRLGRRSRDYWR